MRCIQHSASLPAFRAAHVAIMPPARPPHPAFTGSASPPCLLACSGESHDTAGGSSQRSVLTGARANSSAGDQQSAKVALVAQAAGAAPAVSKAAWGKVTQAVGKEGGGSGQHEEQHPPPPDMDETAFPPLAAAQPPAVAPQPQLPSSLMFTSNQLSGEASADGSLAACSSDPSPQPAMPAAQGVPAGLPPAAAQQEAAAVLAAEVAALRAEVARLQLQQQQTDSLHQRVSSRMLNMHGAAGLFAVPLHTRRWMSPAAPMCSAAALAPACCLCLCRSWQLCWRTPLPTKPLRWPRQWLQRG